MAQLNKDYGYEPVSDNEKLPDIPLQEKLPVFIKEAEEKMSTNNNPYWSLCFEISGGEFKGRKIFETFMTTKEWGIRRLLKLYQVLGFDVNNPDRDYNPIEIVGKHLLISCDKYEEKEVKKDDKTYINKYPKIAFSGFYTLVENTQPQRNVPAPSNQTQPSTSQTTNSEELVSEDEIPF